MCATSTGVGTATMMKSARRKSDGIAGRSQSSGGAQILARYLARRIAELAVTVDFGGRQVETDGVKFLAKFHRERQAHVSQSDNGDDFLHFFRYLDHADGGQSVPQTAGSAR